MPVIVAGASALALTGYEVHDLAAFPMPGSPMSVERPAGRLDVGSVTR